ncbi:MAG: HPF/RaiA family ribosome-associated protein [Terracidiphilus sp.]
MKIQVNSDKTINVDAVLTQIVKDKSRTALDRFAKELTRVEIHLSDINNKKTGRPDKRCLIEVRPAGDRPLAASAIATTTESAVDEALKKMKRLLTTFFGKKGRPATEISAPVPKARTTGVVAKKTEVKETGARKAAAKKPTKLSPRGPKKKGIYQARRKSWPR